MKIIHEDRDLLAIDKAAGRLMHKSLYARDCQDSLIQELCSQAGQKLYPVHRLDRATSGLLLLAKTPSAAAALASQFERRTIEKSYLAIVRGHLSCESLSLTQSLARLGSAEIEKLDAQTSIRCLARFEINPKPAYLKTSRYSLVLAKPKTGRQPQIRRHLKQAHHPIIGDTRYGKGEQNRFFREQYGIHRLLLHSYCLSFIHPIDQTKMNLKCEPGPCFRQWIAADLSEFDQLMNCCD